MRAFLSRFEETAAGILLAAMTFLICLQLILMTAAPTWSSPLTTLILGLFFWTTMLGIPAATRRRAHLSLVLLRRHTPARWQWVLRAAWLAAALAFFATVAVAGVHLCWQLARWGNRFLGSSVPDWVVTAGVPVAGALSCVRAVEAWWKWGQDDTEGGEG